MHHLFRTSQIRIGVFEKTQAKLQLEHPAYRAINQRFGNCSTLDTFNQKLHVSWLVGDIHIHACLQGHLSCLFLIPRYVLIDNGIETAAFAHDDALEA